MLKFFIQLNRTLHRPEIFPFRDINLKLCVSITRYSSVFLDFRFDPLKLLHMLRDKRMMFIGDSLQRGQFESMVCLVQSVVPEGKKSLKRIPPMKIFKAEVYQ